MPLLLLAGESGPEPETPSASANTFTPDGRFLLPVLPPTYVQDWTGAAAQVAPLDQQIGQAWAFLQAVLDAQDVRVALGADLVALGQKYGVQQVAGEGDEQLRARIIGTLRARKTASTLPGLTDRLQQATGVPVSVTDDPTTAGYFTVLFVGSPPQGPGVVALINRWKAAGTDFTAVIHAPAMGQIGRVGDTRVGDRAVGGGQSYIALHTPPPTVIQAGRVGTVRVGTVRV